MTRRRVLHRRERDKRSEGVGFTHSISRTIEPPYERGTPEFAEWLRTPEGMEWVRSHRKEKKGGRRPKLSSVPKKELWELKLKKRTHESIINYLYRHYKIRVSKRTLIRWYQENPTPKDFTLEEDIRKSEYWDSWQDYLRRVRRIGATTKEGYEFAVIGLWKALNKKSPHLWTLEDIQNYMLNLEEQGYEDTSLAKTLVGIRSFIKGGLRRPEWLSQLSTARYEKKKYTVINYFPRSQINKMINNIPPVGYEVIYSYVFRGKKITHKVAFENETERKEIKALIRMFMTTCARIGGLLSIKIEWIDYDNGILLKIEEKGKKGKKRLWENIKLTPRAMEALKDYLMSKYNMKEWNTTELIELHGDEKLSPKSPQKYREYIYAIIQFSHEIGDPIVDQDGRAWTPKRMREEEKHVAHLFRKSFVQNLRREGLHLEEIADLGVGWDDLSTMRNYYGKTSPERIREIWDTKVSKIF
jgi:site-specific recombinase XerD